ncbi:MAG: NAD(P)-dependent oxidoreductase [Nitrospirae bacterium]|nr:MAG: NAD(P)-dependent oxidoreductase [Nitrospirota bacterium]
MNILLTGATGFIGSRLARRLLVAGHRVTALIRPAGDRWRIRDIEPSLSVLEGDLCTPLTLRGLLVSIRPDLLIHLAWGGQLGAPAIDNLTALGSSLELLRLMPDIGCPRVMIAGTCFEYDQSEGELDEESPARPHDLYGACKHALFLAASHFAELAKIDLIWPRLFYVYGPGEDPRRLVPSVVLALLRDRPAPTTQGEQVRDYLHVDDVADALVAIVGKGCSGAINVASGSTVTVAQVATLIGRLLEKPELIRLGALPYREGEPMVIRAGTRRLREEVGWNPRFDLVGGLTDTIGWWKTRIPAA